jgi:hypothetical protein
MLIRQHPGGLRDEACLLEDRACDGAELECERHDDGYRFEVVIMVWEWY